MAVVDCVALAAL
jgi:hypothetical protein